MVLDYKPLLAYNQDISWLSCMTLISHCCLLKPQRTTSRKIRNQFNHGRIFAIKCVCVCINMDLPPYPTRRHLPLLGILNRYYPVVPLVNMAIGYLLIC